MPKRAETPYGYECPYRNACPHLQGMSTEWMWLRRQEDVQERHQWWLRKEQLLRQLLERDQEDIVLRPKTWVVCFNHQQA